MPKTIGIIGTRRRDSKEDFDIVHEEFLKHYEPGDTICSGLCPQGGDRFAVILARKYKTKKNWHPANWKRFGRGAGFIRNAYIARDSDILIACVAADRKGGTEDTIKRFLKAGKKELYLV